MVHVVFGAGQVGPGVAAALVAQGLRVRVVRRSDRPVGEGIEVVAGDARDPAFVREVTRDAAVLYHCMNPSAYSEAAWRDELPAMNRALVAAAVAAGARLVVLDNLYAYGPSAAPRTEASPLDAPGVKGGLRREWDQLLRTTPGLRFVVGRAGDFFGPGAGTSSLLGSVKEGGTALLVGDADAPHGFGYVPDVVAGLVALGTATDDVEGRVFHLPVTLASPRRLAAALGARRSLVVPGWAIRTLGAVVPFFGELRETLYQWEGPFLVDDSAFRTRFPGVASDRYASA